MKLWPKFLRIECIEILRLGSRRNRLENIGGFVPPLLDDKRERLALEFVRFQIDPEVRLAGCELDFKLAQ